MKLFISYSHDDKLYVYELADRLRDDGNHTVWIDKASLVGGESWWDAILNGIANCECVVVIISPRALGSIYWNAELRYAQALNKPILPLMLKPVDMPSHLSAIQAENVSEMSLERAYGRCERALGQIELRRARDQFPEPKPSPERPTVPVLQSGRSTMSQRIFISYSRSDAAFASRLATDLRQHGVDVWIDTSDIHAGAKWGDAIQDGLDAAQIMILIHSPTAAASENVKEEWQYFKDNQKPIIPILWLPAKIHFQISRLQWVDFHELAYETAFEKLHAELTLKGVTLRAAPVVTPYAPAPPPAVSRHVMINYAQKDTRPLAQDLRARIHALPGFTAWMDDSLEPTRGWVRQIQEQIDRADFVVVLISPDVNRPAPHSFVLQEIAYAKQIGKTIIPVMAQFTGMPLDLLGHQYIDFVIDKNTGIKQLIKLLRSQSSDSP